MSTVPGARETAPAGVAVAEERGQRRKLLEHARALIRWIVSDKGRVTLAPVCKGIYVGAAGIGLTAIVTNIILKHKDKKAWLQAVTDLGDSSNAAMLTAIGAHYGGFLSKALAELEKDLGIRSSNTSTKPLTVEKVRRLRKVVEHLRRWHKPRFSIALALIILALAIGCFGLQTRGFPALETGRRGALRVFPRIERDAQEETGRASPSRERDAQDLEREGSPLLVNPRPHSRERDAQDLEREGSPLLVNPRPHSRERDAQDLEWEGSPLLVNRRSHRRGQIGRSVSF